ncbi:MAG TPA: hypothetical protein H9662_07780 [Firmicutes bacterium]|nr:hypothetical protein [Bacillota bacterium]
MKSPRMIRHPAAITVQRLWIAWQTICGSGLPSIRLSKMGRISCQSKKGETAIGQKQIATEILKTETRSTRESMAAAKYAIPKENRLFFVRF